jgi:aprataxin
MLTKSPAEFWKILKPQRSDESSSRKVKAQPRHPLTEQVAPMNYQGHRDGLLIHMKSPELNTNGLVVYFNNDFTLIRDMYPKSTVHFLLLSRDPKFYTIHPFQAFKDADFLEKTRKELENAVHIAADELCRKLGSGSKAQREKTEAMLADEPPDPLPPGRDWTKDIKVGVHAKPSMSHLHIHILSNDNVNKCLKTPKHYQTNNTPFFVRIEEFPLAKNDSRWRIEQYDYTKQNMKCWRCGKDFGRSFSKLKPHLEDELDEWTKE